MAQFSIPIEEIVDLLGLDRSPKNHPGARSIKVHCPFCGHKGYTMDVDLANRVYHCFHCPDDMQKHTGALDLYSRVRWGAPSYQLDRKKVFHELCKELGKDTAQPGPRKEAVYQDRNIYPAEDVMLNRAYAALLKLPYLKLARKHAENLMARGLPEKVAYRSNFASLPQSYILVKDHPKGKEMADWYWSNSIEDFRKASPVLCSYKWKDLVAGMLIANDLMLQGIELKGVPGFYLIAPGMWSFRYDPGMMIPTISYDGNIVGIQTRRDTLSKGGLRYMTLSSKGLPQGVTAKIARTHVIHSKPEISMNTQVYVTEGPLKADVLLWYLTRDRSADVAVIALQGVNNTKELPEIVKRLKSVGVQYGLAALDMDKCGNLAVAEANKAIRRLFRDEGIRLDTLMWDAEYAKEKKAELMALAQANDVTFVSTGNDYVDISALARIFTERHIEYNVRYVDGKKVKDAWNPRSKGIDDWYHYLDTKQSKANQ